MNRIDLGPKDRVTQDDRLVVDVAGREIVVLGVNGRFFAFENVCCHQGGPVGEGRIMPRVEPVLTADGKYVGETFSETVLHIVCPWHGYEYDLQTGHCAADSSLALNTYTVFEEKGRLFLEVDES